VVVCREVDEEDEATPWKEQENWEADQIKKATMKVGSKDKAKQAQQYEFVFEDQIDFIKDMALAGDVVRPCQPPCLPSESSFLAHA
jgi:pre-mRNA-splicing factor ATP-dependent RNA helicase DHX16